MTLYHAGFYVLFVLAMAAVSFVVRYASARLLRQRLQKARANDWESTIAGIRLRLAPGAELVTLEHQIFFYDERNREAAKAIFDKNGFELATAETYEKRTKYWLLASKSALIDRVREELGRVVNFAASYGGRYGGCKARY